METLGRMRARCVEIFDSRKGGKFPKIPENFFNLKFELAKNERIFDFYIFDETFGIFKVFISKSGLENLSFYILL